MAKTIYLAGGCFWGVQQFFDQIDGVINTEVGYANGLKEEITYKEVCSGNFGHVECVKIQYDEKLLSLDNLMTLLFSIIDPTSLNKQGNDEGIQYRTGIYSLKSDFLKNEQEIAQRLQKLSIQLNQPVMVENKVLDNYCSAEEYHQKYLIKNPNGYCHINLKNHQNIIDEINKQVALRRSKQS